MATPPTSPAYSLGGLSIRSDFDLPLDEASHGGTAVAHLVRAPLAEMRRDFAEPRIVCHREVGKITFVHRSVGSFTAAVPLAWPLTIDVALYPDFSEAGLRAILQGPLHAMIAQAGGMLTLHASAVAKGDVGLLIAGPSGAGKSTLAAAMARRGWTLTGDDLALVSFADGVPRLIPNSRSVWLCQDSAQAFHHTPSVARLDGKVRMDFHCDLARTSRLAGLVLPAFGSTIAQPFEVLCGTAAAEALRSVFYGPLIPVEGWSRSRRGKVHDDILSRIVVAEWTRPRDFSQINAGVEQVEAFVLASAFTQSSLRSA